MFQHLAKMFSLFYLCELFENRNGFKPLFYNHSRPLTNSGRCLIYGRCLAKAEQLNPVHVCKPCSRLHYLRPIVFPCCYRSILLRDSTHLYCFNP